MSAAELSLPGLLVVSHVAEGLSSCRLDHGADGMLQDADGNTPLHKACSQVSQQITHSDTSLLCPLH